MTALSGEDSPVYLRLRGTIAAAILRGEFGAGDQLPSVRALAAEAMQHLIEAMRRGRVSSSGAPHLLDHLLVERESTAPPPA